LGTKDDSALLRECQHGSEAAWKTLVARYENLVFSTALQTGLDQEVAVDVFQQVWLELHRSLLRIRDPKALPRWLIVTTRRIAYRQAVVTGRWVRDVREDMIDPTPRADATILALEQRQLLEDAMGNLDDRCREVLQMLFYSDRKVSYQELAEKTGLAEDSIGSLRTRCLKRLRAILEARP
jgi:RNA polymerase sigma factor (sigma-70 family)